MKNLPNLDCCGCSACAERCPKQCISMVADTEGFLYPRVDEELCIHCELCEKVCPVLEKEKPLRAPLKISVGQNRDKNIVAQSSSGGVFTLLANAILEQGGVVFGAKFDEHWDVVHDYVEQKSDLVILRESKYVQSKIGDSYRQVEHFLKENRKVLFTGTPCQVAGLRRYLRKDYENLWAVDLICHGVPGQGVWQKYLKDSVARMCDKNSVSLHSIHEKDTLIKGISFRNKALGWKKFSFALRISTPATSGSGVENTVLLSEPLDKNYFMRGFLADLFLRPSCHDCKFKSWNSGSDITIADAWGIERYKPDCDDDTGCSAVMVLTEKGMALFSQVKELLGYNIDMPISFIENHNPAAFNSAKPHKNRKKFFRLMKKGEEFNIVIDKCLPPPTYWDKVMWSINKRIEKYVKK